MKEIDLLDIIRRRFYYLEGLIALLLLTILIFHYLALNVGVPVYSLIKDHVSFTLVKPNVLYVLGQILCTGCVFYYWIYRRRVPKFRSGQLGILFAPTFQDELKSDVEAIINALEHELASHQLQNEFSIKRLPPNIKITNPQQAERAIRKSGGTTAVWGVLDSEVGDAGRTVGFPRISFTYVHNKALIPPERYAIIAMSMAEKKWRASEDTRIADRAVMAKNIGVTVRNLIGLSLLIDEKWDEAIRVLLPLYTNCKAEFGKSLSQALKTFVIQLGYDLAWATTMKVRTEYELALYRGNLFRISEEKIKEWLSSINESIRLDNQNSSHYFIKAILEFLLGNVEDSIRITRKGQKMAPVAESIPDFSLAFLYNFNGDFQKSRRHYRIALEKKTSHNSRKIEEIKTFIRQCIDHYPEKHQLLLALAIIELNRGSKREGIRYLNKMLDGSRASAALQPFIDEANSLLGK